MPHRFTRTLIMTALTTLVLLATPAPARADVTAFWGFTPTTSTRDTRGFSVGLNTAVFGGEFEWARTSENTSEGGPALKTQMFNGMLITPGRKLSVYISGGWGRYTETLNLVEHTGSASNFGAGVKYRLAGPIKARFDYRAFSLKGSQTPFIKNPKRFYAGVTLAF